MIFTRRENEDEDFYESNFINGKWSNAVPVGGKVNTNLNEGAQNISQDGQWLIFTGCNYPEGQGSCDLYIAYKTKSSGWRNLKTLVPSLILIFGNLPLLFPLIKKIFILQAASPVDMAEQIFGLPTVRNGKWSRPENLGPDVNTSADESCPFMHADNQTLYFNSNGHMGYGMTDLFLSKKLNDSYVERTGKPWIPYQYH